MWTMSDRGALVFLAIVAPIVALAVILRQRVSQEVGYRRRFQTHNAAPAEYLGCAALAYALGNKSKNPQHRISWQGTCPGSMTDA